MKKLYGEHILTQNFEKSFNELKKQTNKRTNPTPFSWAGGSLQILLGWGLESLIFTLSPSQCSLPGLVSRSSLISLSRKSAAPLSFSGLLAGGALPMAPPLSPQHPSQPPGLSRTWIQQASEALVRELETILARPSSPMHCHSTYLFHGVEWLNEVFQNVLETLKGNKYVIKNKAHRRG